MLSLAITLPTAPHPTNATLYYEADYDNGRHWLDYLHIIRMGLYFRAGVYPLNPDAYEENYWSSLDDFSPHLCGCDPWRVRPPRRSAFYERIPSPVHLCLQTPQPAGGMGCTSGRTSQSRPTSTRSTTCEMSLSSPMR